MLNAPVFEVNMILDLGLLIWDFQFQLSLFYEQRGKKIEVLERPRPRGQVAVARPCAFWQFGTPAPSRASGAISCPRGRGRSFFHSFHPLRVAILPARARAFRQKF